MSGMMNEPMTQAPTCSAPAAQVDGPTVPTLTLYHVHGAHAPALAVHVLPMPVGFGPHDAERAAAELRKYLYSFAPGSVSDALRSRFKDGTAYDNVPTLPREPVAVKPTPRSTTASAIDGIRETLASLTDAAGTLPSAEFGQRVLDALQQAANALGSAHEQVGDLRDSIGNLNSAEVENVSSAIDECYATCDTLAANIGNASEEAQSNEAALREELTGEVS